MKINYLNQILLNWYYRKFIELQNQINQSLQNGEFYKMSREFQTKMIERLKVLGNKMARIIEKSKDNVAATVIGIENIARTGLINPANLGFAVGRIQETEESENDNN